jgi:hypothetical protein
MLSIIGGSGAMKAKRVYGIEKLWISIGGELGWNLSYTK